LSLLAYELSFKRQEKGKDKSDGKMRKKTQAVAGRSYGKDRILEVERGSSGSHSVKNSLWKRLWTSHKTDYVMNELINDLFCDQAVSVEYAFPLCLKLTLQFIVNVVLLEYSIDAHG